MARYQPRRPCRPFPSSLLDPSSDESDEETTPACSLRVPLIRIGDLVTSVMVDTGSPINLVSPSLATHEGFLKGSYMGSCNKTVVLPTETLHFDMKFTSRVTMAQGGRCISVDFFLAPHPLKANLLLCGRTLAAINAIPAVERPMPLQPNAAAMESHLLKFGGKTFGALGHMACTVNFVSAQFALTYDFLKHADPLMCTTALDFMGESFTFYSTKFIATVYCLSSKEKLKLEFYVAKFDMPERLLLGRAALLALKDHGRYSRQIGGPTRHLERCEFHRDDRDSLIIKVPRFVRHILPQ